MKISASNGKQNKIHISVDGEYRFTVDSDFWFSCPYCRKTEISDPDECDRFISEMGSRYAFISGLRILSYGDNSRKELTRKLVSKGHNPEYVSSAMDLLEHYGYINDRRYAENYAESLSSRKHMSRNGIKSELIRKGIDSQTVSEVLENMEFDPVSSIGRLLTTKYSRNLSDEKGIRKTVAALQRLGYNWSDIKTALNKYTQGEYFDD